MKTFLRGLALATFLAVTALGAHACSEASAAAPSNSNFTKHENSRWFTGTVNFDGVITETANRLHTPPSTQVLTAGGTILANACGGLKPISSAAAVTTDTTNTFAAPAAANSGCCMSIVNVNASDAITLDTNALFVSAGAANVVLGSGDTVRVCSTGASGKWYQIGATGDN